MADSEWFETDPSPGGPVQYPNVESANDAAREAARRGSDEVDIVRCTRTLVRRYKRQVTVTVEEMPQRT